MGKQYIITDGKRVIHKDQSGRYLPTVNESLAEIFTKKQAEGVYSNSLSKPLRAVFYIQDKNSPIQTPIIPQIKKVTSVDLGNTEKITHSQDVQKWVDRMSGLKGIVQDAIDRKKKLEGQLKQVEDELLDIEHWIEFSKFNGVQGYKISKELKDCRIKRRSIKNELLVLDILLEQPITDELFDKFDRRLQGIDKRSYLPRVRSDLFELSSSKM